MRLKDITIENRPRERLNRLGRSALSEAELLAIILKTGNKNENAVELANRLISSFGFSSLSDCTLSELQCIKGIGFAKACQIVALFELFARYRPGNNATAKITCAEDVFAKYNKRLYDEKKEHFIAVYLDSKNKIIKDETVSIGTLNQTLIHPREVFKGAIKNSASAIIVVHNHPSGDPEPSKADTTVTDILKQSGKIIDIEVLDHIIIGTAGYYSFRENELI